VAVGRACPRLERVEVSAELGQPAHVGQGQQLGWAIIARIFLVGVDHRCLAFPDDHLDPPKVCAVPFLVPGYSHGASPPRKLRMSRYSNVRESKHPNFAELPFYVLG
jgi:hypothetical protein